MKFGMIDIVVAVTLAGLWSMNILREYKEKPLVASIVTLVGAAAIYVVLRIVLAVVFSNKKREVI